MSTLSLVPPLINTGDPDIELIHDKVAEAIDRAEGDAPPAKKRKKKPGRRHRRVDRLAQRGVRRQPGRRPRRRLLSAG